MSWKCEICGKKPVKGNMIVRHGKSKKKGGVGLKVGGITKRWFRPNLQRVRAMVDGKPGRMLVCTGCLRLVVKPPATTKK